jgi:hypothetical protein
MPAEGAAPMPFHVNGDIRDAACVVGFVVAGVARGFHSADDGAAHGLRFELSYQTVILENLELYFELSSNSDFSC